MDRDKILYSIREVLGINTDDRSLYLPDELIMFEYANARATYLEQLYSKGGRYDDTDLTQTIKLGMSMVDRSSCSDVPVGCKILRSTNQLPSSIIYTHRGQLVSHIGPMDITGKDFNLVDYGRVKHLTNRTRIINNSINAFILNNYVYVYGYENPVLSVLKNMAMTAIFEFPDDVVNAGVCVGDCNDYPMKAQYHSYVIQMVVQKLSKRLPEDRVNDAEADVVTIPRPKATKKSTQSSNEQVPRRTRASQN